MIKAEDKPRNLFEWFPTTSHLFLFLRIFLWVQAVPFLYKLLSLPTLLNILTPRNKIVLKITPELLARGEIMHRYCTRILRENPENMGKMCLRRSLVMYRFLRMSGIAAVFYVGVRKEEQELKGHAWIEINGEYFMNRESHIKYFVTFSYPEDDEHK
jgi:Transglutaminase-like superfamily